MSNNSFWPYDKAFSGATSPGQSGPGSDGNEGVLRILQKSSISKSSPSDCLMSYLILISHSIVSHYAVKTIS